MPEAALDAADRERLAADVLAAVERLLREQRSGLVLVNVNGPMRRVQVSALRPDGDGRAA